MSTFIKRIKEKIFDKILLKIKTKNIGKTTYLYNYENTKKQKILLYFPLAEYMHLGDHLFFEPLAKNLKKIGYEISISPAKGMEFYFKELGYLIYKGNSFSEFDLIVSRTEFFKLLIKQKNVVLYEYINTSLKQPICEDIVKKIFVILNEKTEHLDYEPSNLEVRSTKIELDKNKNYILFNNYLDSGKWLNTQKSQKAIEKKALELKKLGYSLIHLGTEKDYKCDNGVYNYIDLDLRGQTSIKDLFYLSSSEKVKGNLGFDAFLMHLFFLNKKKNYICLRNKLTVRRKEVTMNYLNPPFKILGDKKIEYINK